MGNKIIALFIAFIMPVGCLLLLDGLDILNVLGRENRPFVKRYVALTDEMEQSNAIKVNDTLWHTVPDFSFDGHTGRKVTHNDFKDKIFIADFFFSHCPSICPQMSKQLQRVQYEFRKDTMIKILSHTVDPERDSIPRLAEYAELYEADSTKWLFVTGSKVDLYEQARKGYYVVITEGDGGAEDFIHTPNLVLVDKERVIRGYYDGTKEEEVNQMMMDIKTVQLEYLWAAGRKAKE